MDLEQLIASVVRTWDDSIIERLMAYVRIPNKSPDFDPQWEANGHMEKAVDVLFDGKEMHHLGGDRVKVENTHGTGCTFASAITAQLAAGRSLLEATTLAKAYVMKAIEKAYPVGKGRLRCARGVKSGASSFK